MFLDLSNPVNLAHPLNYKRESWWYSPVNTPLGPQAGRVCYDLMRKYDGTLTNGASATIGWSHGDSFATAMELAGSVGDGANCDFGDIYSYTDDFTIGCTFYTTTVSGGSPGPGSGGVMIGKNPGSGSNCWSLARNADYIMAIGTGTLTSGTIAANTVYRVISVYNGSNSRLYVNGVLVDTDTSGAGTNSTAVRIGYGIDNWTWAFRGRIWDCFVASRPWTDDDVLLDYAFTQTGYQGNNSPLRWVKPIRPRFQAMDPVEFSTGLEFGQYFLYTTPANFTTSLRASGSAGGLGDITPGEIAEFSTGVHFNPIFGAGEPTLVSFETGVNFDDTLDASDPVEFVTGVHFDQKISTIANGNPRILVQDRYRR